MLQIVKVTPKGWLRCDLHRVLLSCFDASAVDDNNFIMTKDCFGIKQKRPGKHCHVAEKTKWWRGRS